MSDFEWMRRCSDTELKVHEEESLKRSRDTVLTNAAFIYLVMVAPVLPLMVVIRAAERSHWIEVIGWLAMAAIAGAAYLRWRELEASKRAWHAAIEERRRREEVAALKQYEAPPVRMKLIRDTPRPTE